MERYKNYEITCDALPAVNSLTREVDMFFAYISITGPKNVKGLVPGDGGIPYHSQNASDVRKYALSHAKKLIDDVQ